MPKKGNTIDPKNLNEDNGGNHLYEEENHDGEDIEYNQHQQSENMNDEGLESNGNEENEM